MEYFNYLEKSEIIFQYNTNTKETMILIHKKTVKKDIRKENIQSTLNLAYYCTSKDYGVC